MTQIPPHAGISADASAIYKVRRRARTAGPFQEEQVLWTRDSLPSSVAPGDLALHLMLHPSAQALSRPRPVGSFGLDYARSVWKRGGDREGHFWRAVARHHAEDAPLDAAMIGRGGLRDLMDRTFWMPPWWVPQPGTSGTSILQAWMVVQPGPLQQRVLAYWSLNLAGVGVARRLRVCRTCDEIFLAAHPKTVWCSKACRTPHGTPGRPRSVPESCASTWRTFQNRIYQWRSRGALSRRVCGQLLGAMQRDLEAVGAQSLDPDQFVRVWSERLATWQAAGQFARALVKGQPT